jgi:hypothetical protein
VFGDYIDVYDILQSKEDKATMPIYYEARLAKIDLKPGERPKIDRPPGAVATPAKVKLNRSGRRTDFPVCPTTLKGASQAFQLHNLIESPAKPFTYLAA